MGAGASTKVASALNEASIDELSSFLDTVPEDVRCKLAEAIASAQTPTKAYHPRWDRFCQLDLNGDSYIDLEEFHQALALLDLGEPEVDAYFQQASSSKSMLDFDSFASWIDSPSESVEHKMVKCIMVGSGDGLSKLFNGVRDMRERLRQCSWNTFNNLKDDIDRLRIAAKKIPMALRGCRSYQDAKAYLDDLTRDAALIEYMQVANFKPRHWQLFAAILGKDVDVDSPTFKIQELLDGRIGELGEQIEDLCERAQKEHAVERAAAACLQDLDGQTWQTKKHEGVLDFFIPHGLFENFDDTLARLGGMLEHSQAFMVDGLAQKLQSLKAEVESVYKFVEALLQTQQRLRIAHGLAAAGLSSHSSAIPLHSDGGHIVGTSLDGKERFRIFLADQTVALLRHKIAEAIDVLPDFVLIFEQGGRVEDDHVLANVDSATVKLDVSSALASAWERSTSALRGSIMPTFRAQGMMAQEGLQQLAKLLTNAESSFDAFLAKQRQACPRLYFLSDSVLQDMNMMYHSHGLDKIEKHLGFVFTSIAKLRIHEGSTLAVRTNKDEELTLLEPLAGELPLEEWLSQLDFRVKAAIKSLMLSTEICDRLTPLGLRILKDRLAWTNRMAAQLTEDGHLGPCELDSERGYVVAAIQQARDGGPDEELLLIEALRSFALAEVLAEHTDELTWSKVPKLLVEKTESLVHVQCGSHELVEFGYSEDCFSAPRMLLHPLHEYVVCEAMMRAEREATGIILQGAGAVQTAKQVLSHILGYRTLVFNVSIEMWKQPKVFEKFADGLACSGTWAIFDGYAGSISEEVEERVSQLLQLLHDKLQGRIVIAITKASDSAHDLWEIASANLPSSRAKLQALCGIEVRLHSPNAKTAFARELALQKFADFDSMGRSLSTLLSEFTYFSLPDQIAASTRNLASAASALRSHDFGDTRSVLAAAALLFLARLPPADQIILGSELRSKAELPLLSENCGRHALPTLGKCFQIVLVLTEDEACPGALKHALQTCVPVQTTHTSSLEDRFTQCIEQARRLPSDHCERWVVCETSKQPTELAEPCKPQPLADWLREALRHVSYNRKIPSNVRLVRVSTHAAFKNAISELEERNALNKSALWSIGILRVPALPTGEPEAEHDK